MSDRDWIEKVKAKAAERSGEPLEGKKVRVINDVGELELIDHPSSLGAYMESMKAQGRTYTEVEPGVYNIDPVE